jgi:formate hydrogenlyase subunit 4
VPVDDPLTHLELTMIHEVMVLDHSGPELAAMQYSAGLKMTLYAGLIASLINRVDPRAEPVAAIVVSIALLLLVAVVVGCVESLVARLPMRWVPRYVLLAGAAAVASMVVIGLGASGL